MDTKWNNLIDAVYTFVMKQQEIILGVLVSVIGIFLLQNTISFSFLSYMEILGVSFAANIFLGIGICLLLKKYLERKYAEWIPKSNLFYQEWKKAIIHQEKNMIIIGVIVFIGALLIDYYTYNGIVAGFTVLIQFILIQFYFACYMSKKLDLLMERMEEINKINLEKALEIERKSLEKVSRSDQLRMDLVTNVSHDLKTPLTSMVGYLELLKKEELSDVVRDYVDVIVDKTDKLKEMIESLFSLAKASSGNIELRMEKFEINRLIEQIMADMKDKIDESGLHFVTQLTKENTDIVSDNMYFYRICQNLLENALKYSAKGTRVFVKTYVKENGNLALEMTNTAGYFMNFEKEEILEKFVRGDKSRSTEGNGLGLAIVSTYAKALGGEFDIHIDCDQFKAYLEFQKIKTS